VAVGRAVFVASCWANARARFSVDPRRRAVCPLAWPWRAGGCPRAGCAGEFCLVPEVRGGEVGSGEDVGKTEDGEVGQQASCWERR